MPALLLLAVTFPVLFWQENVDTRAELQKADIRHIAVPSAQLPHWRSVSGLQVDPVEITSAVKLPDPGVAFQEDEASASHIPWVTSNGWHFLRQPKARFYYDTPANAVTLAAAEAFSFGGAAFIHTGVDGLQPFADFLKFLTQINSQEASPIADIGVVDDDSNASGEILNLMVRDNLLFQIVRASGITYKLTVKLGSKPYSGLKDADAIVHKIRSDLSDAKRSVRLFGTSVVIAHLTGDRNHPRLHLLNYGAPAHVRVGGFRVRLLARYAKAQIHSFEMPGEKLLDYESNQEATEFTVPELKTYAVVDLQ